MALPCVNPLSRHRPNAGNLNAYGLNTRLSGRVSHERYPL